MNLTLTVWLSSCLSQKKATISHARGVIYHQSVARPDCFADAEVVMISGRVAVRGPQEMYSPAAVTWIYLMIGMGVLSPLGGRIGYSTFG